MGCGCGTYILREKANGFDKIRLMNKRTKKELAHIRFLNEAEKITIEFVFAHEIRKGYGRRLVESVKTIARAERKMVQTESIPKAVRFFKACGFKYVRREAGLFVMQWKPMETPIPYRKVYKEVH